MLLEKAYMLSDFEARETVECDDDEVGIEFPELSSKELPEEREEGVWVKLWGGHADPAPPHLCITEGAVPPIPVKRDGDHQHQSGNPPTECVCQPLQPPYQNLSASTRLVILSMEN